MFKRQNRLPRGIRFNNSGTFQTNAFVLRIKENGLTLNRFGIIVSKKIDKRAVVRNKIKRMLRRSLEGLSKEMTIGHDMLFLVRPGIINKSAQTNIVLRQILEKANILK